MRIIKVIFQSYLPFQGRFPRVSGQAKMLKEAGHDIRILACDRDGTHPEEEEIDGIPVKRIRVSTGEMKGPLRQLLPLLSFNWKAYRWLRKQSFDMLQCHNLDVVPLGYLVRKTKRVHAIFDAHEPNYYALWPDRWKFMVRVVEWVDRFLARRMDGVTVTNDYQVAKYESVRAPRVALIGNYPSPEIRLGDDEKRDPSAAPYMFGRFGTFYPGVGLEESLQAFRAVVAKHPEERFFVAGRVVDAYRERFEEVVGPIRDNVVRRGPYRSAEMPDLYRQIRVSCLVYPKSDWFRNITPRKFFDSLANGVPVLMTDIGGLGDVIREHECGLVVDERDIDGVSAAMERLINDESFLRKITDNALALARTKYSWEGLGERYARYIQGFPTL